jgi:hypothetical protein
VSRAEYATVSEGLADALDFTRTIGLDSGREAQSYERGGGRGVLSEVDLYTRSVLLKNMARSKIISEKLNERFLCSATKDSYFPTRNL